MRVAMYYSNSDIRIEELPVPEIGPGEILVKVIASGICGSDVLEWYRKKTAPRVLGHEIGGVVEQVGDGVDNFKKGDRVFVTHHVPCNTCRYCLKGHHTACETLHKTNFDPGGFAEYIRVPRINVDRGTFLLPLEMSFEDSVFIEPLACVVRGERLSGIQPGDTVLVLGSGIAGILHIQMARNLGASRIIATDINPYRMDAARRFGADLVLSGADDVAEKIRAFNGGALADRVILCTGAGSAISQALSCVDRGGTLLFFAVPPPDEDVRMPMGRFWRDEVTVRTSYAAAPADIAVSMELIRSRRINTRDMITHRLPLDEAQRGFELVSKAAESLKVILYPHTMST